MTQKARPIDDISNDGWEPSPLYPQINEPLPNDASFVRTDGSGLFFTFDVLLAPLGRPPAGVHKLRFRWRKQDAPIELIEVRVVCGTLLIARRFYGPGDVPTTFTTHDFELTPTEIGSITDYADLRVGVYVRFLP
jgi:hypothetical protein